MAISYTHYKLLSSLKSKLPHGGMLLEIGEANWYGDLDPAEVGLPRCANWFDTAKAFYRDLFAPTRVDSVDMNGTPAALGLDLNAPLPLKCCYDISINHGTAEHIFNIGQVFRSMHDWTKAGGLMIHESPCTGWLDHGFYTLQPTLFYDLAAANGYKIELIALEEIASRTTIKLIHRDHFAELAKVGDVPNNSMLFVAMRKAGGAFRVPMQGYYDRKLSEAGNRAWETLR